MVFPYPTIIAATPAHNLENHLPSHQEICYWATSYRTLTSGVRAFPFPREDLVVPRLTSMRRYSRHVICCPSVRLCLLEFMDQFPLFQFHRAFGETSLLRPHTKKR